MKPVAKARAATASRAAGLSRPSRQAARALRGRRARTALADYELLELLLFRSIPRADTKPLAKALLDAVRHRSPKCSARRSPCCRRSRASARRSRSTSRSSPPPASAWRAERDQGPRDPVVVEQGDRLLPGRHGLRGARAVPHPVPRQEERADRRRSAADRHGRSHAGLSARGGPPRAGTVGDARSCWCTTTRRATRRRRAPTSR